MKKEFVMIESTDMKEIGNILYEFNNKLDHMVAYFTGRTIFDENDHWEKVDTIEGLKRAEELHDNICSILNIIDQYHVDDRGQNAYVEYTISETELDVLAEINNRDE